jgi:hypothetical protein
MKLSKTTHFPLCYHAIFGHGLLIERRTSESCRDISDCVFMEGSAPRTILSSCLLLFNETRTASLPERKAIRRWVSRFPKPEQPESEFFPDSGRAEAELVSAEVEEL